MNHRNTVRTLLALCTALVLAFAAIPALASAPYGPALTPSEVIGRINAYRRGAGLYEYTHNATLMRIAQAQADYMASSGTVTHTGPGGTRPIDRAYAAGYGDGHKIFVTEIIYGGYQSTVDTAITWWKNSSLHNDQMLAQTYTEIGAGVAVSGESTYYVSNMGWVTSLAAPSDAGTASGSTDSGSGTGGDSAGTGGEPAVLPAVPVVKATPGADGSIVHIIRSGQALWTLSAVYEVPLEVILAQNELPEWAFVHPGDEIVIQPATGEQPVVAPTASAGDAAGNPEEVIGAPTAVSQADASDDGAVSGGVVGDAVSGGSGAATPPAEAGEALAAGDDANAVAENGGGALSSPARWIVAGAFVVLVLVVLGSLFIQSPPARPEDRDPVR